MVSLQLIRASFVHTLLQVNDNGSVGDVGGGGGGGDVGGGCGDGGLPTCLMQNYS